MKLRLALTLAGVVAAMSLAGTASAVVVDQGGASGVNPQVTLDATLTTTAFAVGAWTYSPAAVTVNWQTNCLFWQNDRFGQVVLPTSPASTPSAVVFTASRQVGTPWLGWDFCHVVATYTADFGANPDGSAISSALSTWLVSHS